MTPCPWLYFRLGASASSLTFYPTHRAAAAAAAAAASTTLAEAFGLHGPRGVYRARRRRVYRVGDAELVPRFFLHTLAAQHQSWTALFGAARPTAATASTVRAAAAPHTARSCSRADIKKKKRKKNLHISYKRHVKHVRNAETLTGFSSLFV